MRPTTQTADTTAPDFAALLTKATTEPGVISEAYSRFHDYSLGNMLLAYGQLQEREIPIGPIATFQGWKELGRYVRKGEKAIALIQPITCKRRANDITETNDSSDPNMVTFTRFMLRRNWFVLAQTDGADYQPAPTPAWDRTRALAALDITEIPFDHFDGNTQGYASGRSIAINPVAALPHKTTFHECAHVILGHTTEGERSDDERTPRDIREVEAEATAMLCCAALGLPGLAESRGYIQSWHASGEPIPEASARKIFKTADTILRAGREHQANETC
jgi:antirestriction protein ArdC